MTRTQTNHLQRLDLSSNGHMEFSTYKREHIQAEKRGDTCLHFQHADTLLLHHLLSILHV